MLPVSLLFVCFSLLTDRDQRGGCQAGIGNGRDANDGCPFSRRHPKELGRIASFCVAAHQAAARDGARRGAGPFLGGPALLPLSSTALFLHSEATPPSLPKQGHRLHRSSLKKAPYTEQNHSRDDKQSNTKFTTETVESSSLFSLRRTSFWF